MAKIGDTIKGYTGKLYFAPVKTKLSELKCPACDEILVAEEYRMEPGRMWIDPFLDDGDLIEVLREPKRVLTFKCPQCFTKVEIPFDEIKRK